MPEGDENGQQQAAGTASAGGTSGNVIPAGSGAQSTDQKPNGENGYPADTPLAQMTSEQRENYWKFHARKHEQAAQARGDYDQIKAERDQLKSKTQTAEEKALEEAKEEARRQGENLGAQRYLKDAVSARLAAHLSRSAPDLTDDQLSERVSGILDVVDLTKFVDDKGDLLNDKIKALTGSFVTQASGSQQGQQNHHQLHAGGRTGGSPGGTIQSGMDAYAARKAQRTGSLTKS